MTFKSRLLIIKVLLPFILLIPAAYSETIVAPQNQQQTVTLNIKNMDCSLCTITIKKALQNVEGVQKAVVDYATKTAVVTFDSHKTNSAALIKATTDAGYPGSLATEINQ